MQAPAVGQICAEAITGDEPAVDISSLRPGRFAEGALLRESAVI
jgi:glycine/D-amino acid oxidase-like deaminating enzyme